MTGNSGSWIELHHRIERPTFVYCHACGAMIPRRAWLAGDPAVTYCSPACEKLEARVADLERRHGTRETADD